MRGSTDGTYGTHGTYVIRAMKQHPGFILPHGNYRELLSYKRAKVVYDVPFAFCGRLLVKGGRTIDQMGSGSSVREIEYPRTQQSFGYVEGDASQTDAHPQSAHRRDARRLP